MKAIETRLQKLEAQCQCTEEDSRKSPGWLAYRQTLLKYLADYSQKGLLDDVQGAFDDLEVRPGPVTDADLFYALEPLWQKHRTEFAPDPRTADHFALIARFKAEGLTEEDLVDTRLQVRQAEPGRRQISGRRQVRRLWDRSERSPAHVGHERNL